MEGSASSMGRCAAHFITSSVSCKYARERSAYPKLSASAASRARNASDSVVPCFSHHARSAAPVPKSASANRCSASSAPGASTDPQPGRASPGMTRTSRMAGWSSMAAFAAPSTSWSVSSTV